MASLIHSILGYFGKYQKKADKHDIKASSNGLISWRFIVAKGNIIEGIGAME